MLAIDLDSQGNLTELLSNQPSMNSLEDPVLEAMQKQDVKKVYSTYKNLDLLPATNFLATFPGGYIPERLIKAIQFLLKELLV